MDPIIPFHFVQMIENSLIRGTSAKRAFFLFRIGGAALSYLRVDHILLCFVLI